MAKNISLLGADYPDVPAVQLPQTGGGTATFYDIEVIDNLNSDSSTDALSAKQGKKLNTDKVDWPSAATGNNGAIFDGATGKAIKDSGYTLGKSVPSDAKFTDTTYTAGSGLALSNGAFRVAVPRVAESANHLPGANSFQLREYANGANYNLPTNHYYHIYEAKGSDGNYGTQLALGMTTDAIYYRKYSGGTWGSWKQILLPDDIIDNLNSDSSTDALSAKQGKVLKDGLDALNTAEEYTGANIGTAKNGATLNTDTSYTKAIKCGRLINLYVRITCPTMTATTTIFTLVEALRPYGSGQTPYIPCWEMWNQGNRSYITINANGNISVQKEMSGKDIEFIATYISAA